MHIWPLDKIPLANGNAPQDIPTIAVYLPEGAAKPTPAVLVCPGGGYRQLCATYEGHHIATWLNSFGFAGIVLRYRLYPYLHPVPLMDAQRAIRLVRHHAADWNIDPNNVGVMGFSAGGHLASTLATHYDAGTPQDEDPVQRQSSRPDFQALVYPVISFVKPIGHTGSAANLLGPSPSEELALELSNHLHVTTDTPQAFLAHSVKDQIVHVDNSRLYANTLRNHNVPVEYLELPNGLHGLGCGKGPEWDAWQRRCKQWLCTLAKD